MCKTLLTIILAGGVISTASAGQIQLSPIGGGVVLNSGPMSGISFGSEPGAWNTSSTLGVNAALTASGISTNGKITFLAADTDHGLAFMAIVDQELVQESASLGNLGFVSVANGASLAYVNDSSGSVDVSVTGPNSRTATGSFIWNSNGGGAAFAWAGLVPGNAITYRFNKVSGQALGLDDVNTFQFANWTGTTWELLNIPASDLNFSATDDYGFASTVVPAPASIALIGVSLLTMSSRRRAR
ncbi:MAG: hypothetical protein WC718_08265 [Phycisphaerales bacterium]|jgi:hypothetical protein